MNHRIHNQVVNFIWGIADDVLRDNIKRGKWADVILPFTVLRRLDALLAPTKQEVLDMIVFLESQDIAERTSLTGVTKFPFYNTSRYTFENLLNDPDNIDANLEEYLDGFSQNVLEIITKFRVRNYLGTLKDAGLTYMLIQKFASRDINLSPVETTNTKGEVLPPLTNHGMGFVFEELVRKFSEDNNEEAGQHFTPREVIKLMTNLIFLPVKNELSKGNFLVYDPCCGSGGMLTEAEQFAETLTNGKVDFELYGQESEPEIYAICTADMLIKGDNPENIFHGSTLSNDGFPHTRFDFMMSNPPYGKSWKIDQDAIIDGKKKEIKDSRFTMGVPRVSDGQLLFLVHMLSKMKHDSKMGSRIASVHNGSALFTGDAGGGESEIRKWMIESDWVECIIQLPNNMFYNTGISTYIWILSNRKDKNRKDKIQLIDASESYRKMRKNLGNKSNELSPEHIKYITDTYLKFEQNGISKIFDNEDFGYWKVTVERPLRLAFQLDDEKLEDIGNTSKFRSIMKAMQAVFGKGVNRDFNQLKKSLNDYLKKEEIKLTAKERQAFTDAITWKDEEAEPVIKKKTKAGIEYEPDSELRDYENVPLKDDIQAYFEREVLPHVPDAWINEEKTVKGYEISFTKIFYKYEPLRSLEEITKDILALEEETEGLIKEIIA